MFKKQNAKRNNFDVIRFAFMFILWYYVKVTLRFYDHLQCKHPFEPR